MFEIIIKAENTSRTVAVESINANGNATTISDICEMDAVVDFFDAEPGEIKASLTSVNGNDVPDAFRAVILGSAVENGAVIDFSIEGAEEEDDTEDDSEDSDNAGEAATGTAGTCTVYTSGGLQSTNINIVNGVTTVHDAIYNDSVRGRSGMTDAQLSNCDVTINDAPIAANALASRKVVNGDCIKLDIRVAHTKGC